MPARKEVKFNELWSIKYPSFGSGKETVYIFYYKSYKVLAGLLGYDYWPCKIGMTVTTIFDRLKATQAAMPEKYTIPFVIKSTWALELETLLHMKLYHTKKRPWLPKEKYYAEGTEWFLTNPQEIYDTAKEYGQLEKGAKAILEEHHAERTGQ